MVRMPKATDKERETTDDNQRSRAEINVLAGQRHGHNHLVKLFGFLSRSLTHFGPFSGETEGAAAGADNWSADDGGKGGFFELDCFDGPVKLSSSE
jgi:hypothetical protein